MTSEFQKQLDHLIKDAEYYYLKSLARGDIRNARHYERRLKQLRGEDDS